MTKLISYTLVTFFLLTIVCGKDSFLVLKGTQNFAQETIQNTHVADLLAHVNGLSSVHDCADRTGFPVVNAFQLPKANLLVVLDAVSQDLLEKAERDFLDSTNAIEIIKDVYPDDSVSLLTTIMTGEDWETHGILGNSWKATDYLGVQAFSQNGQCKVPNLIEILSHNGENTINSFIYASSQKMAQAMGIHKELFDKYPEWNSQILVNGKHGVFDLFTDEIVGSISAIRTASQKRMMKVETREGFILATELFMLENLESFLSKDDNSRTNFIGLGLTSIKVLASKFGSDSEQVVVALRLLDRALSNLYARLETLYESQITAQIIGLGSSTVEHTTQTHVSQIRKLQEDYYGYQPTNNTYTFDEVSAFQTQLWTAVGLIIIVIIAILYLVKMDKLYESLLYKTTDGPRPIQNVK